MCDEVLKRWQDRVACQFDFCLLVGADKRRTFDICTGRLWFLMFDEIRKALSTFKLRHFVFMLS